MRYVRLMICMIVLQESVSAQDTAIASPLSYHGYVKYNGNVITSYDPHSVTSWEWLHHRLKLNYTPSKTITAVLELRTRLFQGEFVRDHPELPRLFLNPNDVVQLQKEWKPVSGTLAVSRVDRLYADFSIPGWHIRCGRQRINWGSATVWNPNDIYNVYDLLDFDYPERGGTDALTVRHTLSEFSTLELAYAPTQDSKEKIAACRFGLNLRNYDFTVLAGTIKGYTTAGIGWAGNIYGAGFRGEAQFYTRHDTTSVLNVTAEWDYMFTSSWYIGIAGLYCSSGTELPPNDLRTNATTTGPLLPMPFRWNSCLRIQKTINILWSMDMIVLYAPQSDYCIAYPSLTYNASNSIDITLGGQTVLITTSERKPLRTGSCFASVKWSY